MAEAAAESIHADISEIRTVKESQPRGLAKFIWGGSQVMMKKLPEIKALDKNPMEYDLIFIGTPVWAGSVSPPVNTVFSKNIITGKNIALFYCHLGGAEKVIERFSEVLGSNTLISSQECVNVEKIPDIAAAEITSWAKKLANGIRVG